MYLHKVISRKTFLKIVFGQGRKKQNPEQDLDHDPFVRSMDSWIQILVYLVDGRRILI
jgi:hypothetical protein